MGMTCTLYRVGSSDIPSLATDPAAVRRVLFDDDENWTVTKPKGCLGFILRFTPLSIETATRNEPLTAEDMDRVRENACDLEGAWHGLHFLFTGTAWDGDEPGCYLVQGGDPVGDDDLDQPPRLLRSEAVRAFSRFLNELSDDELRLRYDPERMRELKIDSVGSWTGRSDAGDAGLAHLLEALGELRSFTARTAAAGDGLLLHLA